MVDGHGRRVARRINGQFDKAWLYRDALRPIAEVAADGTFTHFVYASNDALSGAPVAMLRAGVFYRIITDHIGSVRLVINAQTGAVAQSIDFDAYGRVLNETGAGFQPFGFAGGLCDADTKLVRFGARDYDAETGRWTNKDPIGFAGQQGNQYAYVGGEPVNGVDRTGLDKTKVVAKLVQLTDRGMKVIKKLFSMEEAVAVAKGGGDLIASNSPTAREIAERAGAGRPIRHPAHISTAGTDARPHYHPKGTGGHVFYSLVPIFDINADARIDLADLVELVDMFGPIFYIPDELRNGPKA